MILLLPAAVRHSCHSWDSDPAVPYCIETLLPQLLPSAPSACPAWAGAVHKWDEGPALLERLQALPPLPHRSKAQAGLLTKQRQGRCHSGVEQDWVRAAPSHPTAPEAAAAVPDSVSQCSSSPQPCLLGTQNDECLPTPCWEDEDLRSPWHWLRCHGSEIHGGC